MSDTLTRDLSCGKRLLHVEPARVDDDPWHPAHDHGLGLGRTR